jgi:hypothetical protein
MADKITVAQSGSAMQPISYARHQFPAEVIRHATWLYLRFTLSYRDVEELLAELPPRPGASSRCQLDDCRRTVKCGHGDERSNAGLSRAARRLSSCAQALDFEQHGLHRGRLDTEL